MSENPASKIEEKNPEKETSIPEETVSNATSAEFEENSISELKEDDIPKTFLLLMTLQAELIRVILKVQASHLMNLHLY